MDKLKKKIQGFATNNNIISEMTQAMSLNVLQIINENRKRIIMSH
jgi:hypothetical protein